MSENKIFYFISHLKSSLYVKLVADAGLEPTHSESKSDVLPIY